MQPYPLLQTKLHVPSARSGSSTGLRARLVSRPRLIGRLNAGLCRKLTLISAPAGFGKTTLLAEWVRSLSEAGTADGIAWLSLDEDDNDLAPFLVYVVAALSKIEAHIGRGVLNQLHPALLDRRRRADTRPAHRRAFGYELPCRGLGRPARVGALVWQKRICQDNRNEEE